MATKLRLKRLTLLDFYRLFLGLGILENILAGWYLFSLRSKTQNVFLAGFSLQRIAAGFAIFLVLGVYVFLLYDSIQSRKFLKFLASRLERILKRGIFEILGRSALIIIMVCSLARLLFYWLYMFPDFQRFVFFLSNNYIPWELETLPKILIGWVFLISLKILILDLIWGRKASRPLSVQARLMIVSWTIEILVMLYFVSWSLITRKMALDILLGPVVKILILSVWFTVWAFLGNRKGWGERIFLGFTCVSIWLCVFLVSLQFAQWFGAWNTPSINHFNLLAEAFLHGKLYLSNPANMGDLTFYKGHLYVAEPPFPAVLMLPFIAIWGVQAFNTTTFSLVLAGITAVTVYLILHRLIHSGWIGLSGSGAIWLTALFSFGTMYWWLSILSKVWFFSQVVTVLLCALAFLAAVNDAPAWVSGLCLGAAILCRPDVFTLWPALLAIAIQHRTNERKIKWTDIAGWGAKSAIPVLFGVGLLLCYNLIRFGNFFDFGYVTINGGSYLLQQVQAYGLFSPHFISENLHWMFLALPPFSAQCGYFLTRGWGMSMLVTTPAILYLFRKFKISWWTIGCWCSILLSVILLSMYSNNGALQYGYRYMMDFILPVILLIANNAGERISAPLKALIIASIFINYYGTLSWFKGPC
jgi:hypothetical protein